MRGLRKAVLALVVATAAAAAPPAQGTINKLSEAAQKKIDAASASPSAAALIDAAKAVSKADAAKGTVGAAKPTPNTIGVSKEKCCGRKEAGDMGAVVTDRAANEAANFDANPLPSAVFSAWPKVAVKPKVAARCGVEDSSVCTSVGASDIKVAGTISYCDGADADDQPMLNKIRFRICKGADGSKLNLQCLDFGKTALNSSVSVSLVDDETSKVVGPATRICPANALFNGDAPAPTEGVATEALTCPSVHLGGKPWLMSSVTPYPIATDDEGKSFYKLKIRVKTDNTDASDKPDSCVVLTVPAAEDTEGNSQAYFYSFEPVQPSTKPCKYCNKRLI